MTTLRALVGILLGAVLSSGCSTVMPVSAEPVPCIATFSSARCEAILVWVAGELGLAPNGIDRVDIVPSTPSQPDELGRDKSVNLRVHLPDGPSRDVLMQCFGVSAADVPRCMAEPRVALRFPGPESGYGDMPEGAAPFPALDPAAVAAAQPLLIAHRTVTIDTTGPTRVVLGQALLANGVIQEASIELGDAWPDAVVLSSSITMEMTPAAGGDPITNKFVHGWHDGVELVEVSIRFDVAIVREGAALELVNVIVR